MIYQNQNRQTKNVISQYGFSDMVAEYPACYQTGKFLCQTKLQMKHFLTLFLILLAFWSNSQNQSSPSSSHGDTDTTASIATKLNIPFGTIAKLEVEVYDGDSLQMKSYQGTYLLKINSVNGRKISETLLLTFIDETEELAKDNFELYKLTYGKTTKSIADKQVDKMKKKYVGGKLTIMAYETGRFTGIPTDYFKYRPVRADRSFHFENYLVVVSNLTKQSTKEKKE